MEKHDPNDPVSEYKRELSTIEPLTKHEEISLFQELCGTTAAERRETIERRLIESQLALVVSIAEKHTASGIPVLDLVLEGNLGLMRSVSSFAETPTADFPAFAANCIEDSITKACGESK